MVLSFLAFFSSFSVEAQITEFPLLSSPARPQGIVLAPDGALWFTEFGTWRIGRVDTNGLVSEPFFFTTNTSPFKIIVGPDGNLWFTEATVDKVARISRGTNGSFTNGILTEFPLHPGVNTNTTPSGLASGPDGNIWILEYSGNKIAVVNTNGSNIVEYGSNIFQTNAQLYDITAGPDGKLWFTELTYGKVGNITTAGAITEFTLMQSNVVYSNSEPLGIITGPDNAMWFTEFNSNRIGRLTLTGNYSDLVIPTLNPNSGAFNSQEPYYLTVGGDSNIWFTEYLGGNIGRITPSTNGPINALSLSNGFITEFPSPFGFSFPTCITSGPDNSIWFGEYFANSISRFILPTLNISLSTNFQFVLTWPVAATGFTLQGNTNLSGTNWVNLTVPAPFVVSNLFVYTNTATNLQFFRLFEP